MSGWRLLPPFDHGTTARAFASLDTVFALDGERISRDPQSEVIRVTLDGARYYVKRYHRAGKNPLRRWLGRPRVEAEWENLLAFAAWGLPTAAIVGHGLERRWGAFRRGALITRELDGVSDLAQLARERDPRLRSPAWLAALIGQVAHITRTLHAHRFTHNDLKWRNLLVDDGMPPALYLIDCPSGQHWPGPFLRYRIVKDLACLDKVARQQL
ncbi:MAG: heptose kinase, partial [Azoarcus sp.]|nr:heptose kinase [Azoarcus sp.]